MSKVEICDICEDTIMESFTDVAYKVTKIGHAYDGYNPFRHRWSVDICPDCMKNLTHNLKEFKKRRPHDS